MEYYTFSINRLKDYEKRKQALENIPEQIKNLEMQFTAIRSATTDETPVQGGKGNRREDMLIYNISKREELKYNYSIVEREVNITEKGLAVLNDNEKRILYLFFVNRAKDYIERLCDELFMSRTDVYRHKDAALKKFTMAVYGIVDL